MRALRRRPRSDAVPSACTTFAASSALSSTIAWDSNNSTCPIRSAGMPASLATAPTMSPTRTPSRLPAAKNTRCFPSIAGVSGRWPAASGVRIGPAMVALVRAVTSSRRAPSYNRSAAAASSSESCVSRSGASSAISLADVPPEFARVVRSAVRRACTRLSAFALRAAGVHASARPLVMRRKAASSSGINRATASTGRAVSASSSASYDTGDSHNTTSATCWEVA